tara:strand:- start:3556 stop:4110 length:555 start_codon:yes stop_codon:yes gene_type:complete
MKPFLGIIFFTLVYFNTATAESIFVEIRTNKGDITLQLFANKAPISTKNFLAYIDEGFYDGTIFHRVIKDFMIQGGGLLPTLERKKTKNGIANESKNGLKNTRGTVAMARSRNPNSATSQFFINHRDNPRLDYPSFDGWGYAVFGKVVEGMDVVDVIANLPTKSQGGRSDVPSEQVLVKSIARK